MAQLTRHRADSAARVDDFSVSHFDSVRSLRTDCNNFLYADPDVSSVRHEAYYAPMADETIGSTLRRLYERSGLSYTKIAHDAGMAGRSSVQRYFSEDFDGPLTAGVCEKLVQGFRSSNILPEEIWALAQLPPPNALAFQMADSGAPRMARDCRSTGPPSPRRLTLTA